MLLQLTEDQEAAICHPLRLGIILIAVAANYDDAWIHKVAGVFRLNNFVELEAQARAVVDTEDLWVRYAVVEPKADRHISDVHLKILGLDLLFVAWLCLPFDAGFSKELHNDLSACIQQSQHVLQLGFYGRHLDPGNEQDTINRSTTVLVEIPVVEDRVCQSGTLRVFLHASHERWRRALEAFNALLE